MQIRHWVLAVRLTNILSSATLMGLQVWFMIELLLDFPLNEILARIYAPIFLIMLSFLMVTSEFRYKKVVEYFKFLQEPSGLIVFNLLYNISNIRLASLLSLEFSTVHNTFSIIVSSIYIFFSIVFLVLLFLRPDSIPSDYAQML